MTTNYIHGKHAWVDSLEVAKAENLSISPCTFVQYFVVVVLLFYVHGKHLRSCRDVQLT